jgi:hypothetical protein
MGVAFMRRCFRCSFLGLFILVGSPAAFPQTALPIKIIEGIVVNSITGAPIAGARVKAEIRGSDPLYAMTDEQGLFKVTDLGPWPGAYRLTAERPGFMRADTSQGEMQTALATNPVPPGAEKSPPANKILLLPYGAITGRITDPNGTPMARVEVAVSPLDQGLKKVDYTDDTGQYRVAFLKPGRYYVAVARSNDVATIWLSSYHQTYFPAALDPTKAQALDIAGGQEARADIRIVSLSGVRVAGRIRAPQASVSSPVALRDTWVELKPRSQTSGSGADAKYVQSTGGAFEFAQVPPGQYTVTAATTERPAGTIALEDRKTILGTRAEISVGDRDIESVQLEMEALPGIHGRVVFAEGCKAPLQVGVRTVGPSVPREPRSTPAEDGTFELTSLNPGHLTVYVWPMGVPLAKITQVRLGDAPLADSSFDYPLASPADLQISVGCEPRKAKP